ncbi:TraC family protein, partial [Pseudomonas helleri]|nr:TraC family protein [Pseudomonas helleri]
MPKSAHVDAFASFTLAILLLFVGKELAARVAWLRRYGIPEPVVGGMSCAAIVCLLYYGFDLAVAFALDARDMLLEDGQSVAAFYELVPLGTEGREPGWLAHARDALENALQDSFDELDENPWVLQLYAQDEPSFDQYMQTLRDYVQPRARDTAFTEFYLRFFGHHLRAVAKPGGLFEDTVVTRLRW